MIMKTKNLLIPGLMAGLFALAVTSCEDDEDLLGGDSNLEAQLGEQQVAAEAVSSSIYNLADQIMRDTSLQTGDTITVNNAPVTKNGDTVWVMYGNGVSGTDGITRKGTVEIIANGDYTMSGSRISISLLNYQRDGDDVDGSLTVNNNGNNEFGLTVSNFGVNNEFTFNANKTLFWTSGFNTVNDLSDDKYGMSGTASLAEVGTNNQSSSSISDTLNYDRSCQYGMVDGVIDLTFSGDSIEFDTGTIDFLDADGCNNIAQISLSDTTSGRSVNTSVTFNGF